MTFPSEISPKYAFSHLRYLTVMYLSNQCFRWNEHCDVKILNKVRISLPGASSWTRSVHERWTTGSELGAASRAATRGRHGAGTHFSASRSGRRLATTRYTCIKATAEQASQRAARSRPKGNIFPGNAFYPNLRTALILPGAHENSLLCVPTH